MDELKRIYMYLYTQIRFHSSPSSN